MNTGKAMSALFSILVVMSLSGGVLATDWTPDTRLTSNGAASYTSQGNAHCVACDDLGTAHAVWHEVLQTADTTVTRVCYKWYNSTIWGEVVTVSEAPVAANASQPSLVAEPDGALHLIWVQSTRIYYSAFDGSAWSAPAEVTPDARAALTPSLARGSYGRLHMVWRDTRDDDDEIYYKQHDGVSWGPDVRLTASAGQSESPAVAAGRLGAVHVVWCDYRDGASEIYYKRFDGLEWGPDTRLTYAGVSATCPAIAADSAGRVCVAWSDLRDGNPEIYAKVWNGATWGPDTRLTTSSGTSWNPSAALGNDGSIHVAWHGNRDGNTEIYYKVFDGTSWGGDQRLTTAASDSQNPSLALASNGEIHVVWYDYRDANYEIYFKIGNPVPAEGVGMTEVLPPQGYRGEARMHEIHGSKFITGMSAWLAKSGSPDMLGFSAAVQSPAAMTVYFDLLSADTGLYDVIVCHPSGDTDTLPSGFTVEPGWGDCENLSNDTGPSVTSRPGANCIATDLAGNVHVVWYGNRDGTNRIYYKKYDGVAWSPEEILSGGLTACGNPSIAVDSADRLHVVWHGKAGTYYWIYYTMNDGSGWTTPVELTPEPNDSDSPAIACDSSNRPHVVWQRLWAGAYEIIYRFYDGTSWSIQTRMTLYQGRSTHPDIAVDANDDVHLIYNQLVDPINWLQIIYRKKTADTWGPSIQLTSGNPAYGACIFARSGSTVHVVYKHSDDYGDLYYIMSEDGETWTAPEMITDGTWRSANPAIAVDATGTVHAVWHYNMAGNLEICYAVRSDTGWLGDRFLTHSDGNSEKASLAVDLLGRIHVVWNERLLPPYNWEVFYKAWDPCQGSAGTPDINVPSRTRMANINPNPCRGAVRVGVSLVRETECTMSIYDVSGRLVWNDVISAGGPGKHTVTWDGLDLEGRRTSPGVYLLRVSAGEAAENHKVVVLR